MSLEDTQPGLMLFGYQTARWQLYYVAIVCILTALAVKYMLLLVGLGVLVAVAFYFYLRIPTILFCIKGFIRIFQYKRNLRK